MQSTETLKLIENYLKKNPDIPSIYHTQLADKTPRQVRTFVNNFFMNSSALDHFSFEQLIQSPDLWFVGTDIAKERDKWLQEVYPKYDDKQEMTESILVCGKCHQRKVDYYQKQTRGADEPMTCFCHCLNCGARWVQ